MVALDVSDLDEAERLATDLRAARRHAEGGPRTRLGAWPGGRAPHRVSRTRVRDAKLHDIPNTVERASANIARLGCRDAERPRARRRGDDARRARRCRARRSRGRPSHAARSSPSPCCRRSPGRISPQPVLARVRGTACRTRRRRRLRRATSTRCARCAARTSASWCRASVRTAATATIRCACLTPSAALDAGADYLVVGRPITGSDDPVGVARGILLGAR